ncbi:hypothetical protein [Kitasatospora viridis]|uniref:Uncharacterized protein n=1 Tax=Kitasatospora viridis TaxID=281105 RepID=A0A561SED1_9ACTN|nr:hypothetical protein [Kitasatospora viridis]TWF73214.1 hypothetical protein FHX73_16365 [Kitasatospora viridis]
MSKVTDLQGAQADIELSSVSVFGIGGTSVQLANAIGNALSVAGPAGSPAAIRDRAHTYGTTAAAFGTASEDLHKVAAGRLPEAWTGSVAECAGEAIQGVAGELLNSRTVLGKAAGLLNTWADDLAEAQAGDALAVIALQAAQQQARAQLGPADPATTKAAITAVGSRITAAQKAESCGTQTASMLNQLAAAARSELAGQGSLDPLSAVVLANLTGPGGQADSGYLLTPNELSRATQIMGTMNGTDQAAFQQLLAGAKSPDEAAYLYKALAAGHSVADVQQFDALIHGHGDDPTWLSQHLVPDLTSGTTLDSANPSQVTYMGSAVDSKGDSIYNQGGVGDCVAASTVIAQAKLDPVLMLSLTTGNTPDVPGADSADNFQQRLQKTYISNYIQGQITDGSMPYPFADGGIGPKGGAMLANQDLGTATGSTYEYVSLGNDADRQAALGRIEHSVDSGQPVPIDVFGSKEGHQMAIIGRNGNLLEIYNPWGQTSWVTEDQFVHSQLGGVTGSDMNTAGGLELPK